MAEHQPESQNLDIEAEADDYDNDSALGGASVASSTTPIKSSVTKYRLENGRTYHSYKVSLDLAVFVELLPSIFEFSFLYQYCKGQEILISN